MSISTGHLWFALFFAIAFAVIIGIAYRQDLKVHRRNYKQSWKIVLAIGVLLTLFLAIKRWLL
jgi:cytochrome bd-type quinol oxidase subunit 1